MSKAFAVDEFKQLDATWAEGATDPNTAALALGLGSVYQRKGNYPTVPDELYLKLGGGATGVGWSKQNLVNLKIYNITDPAYGAVGDGVTDCRAAIAAAIAAASAAGGGVVYIPAAALGYAVHINPAPGASSCIPMNGIMNVTIMGDGFGSWLKMAGDYLTHSQWLFQVSDGSTRINFYNFRCNGQSIINPNAIDQNHYIQVSSALTDSAPPTDIDVRRMWFDPIVGTALRLLGEASPGPRLVSNIRFLYNACNLGDGAGLGRSCVEGDRNASQIFLHYNWMAPVSPIQGGQNIDFEPGNNIGPDRFSILGNIIVSQNAFSVTLSGVDGPPRSPSTRNLFEANIVIGSVSGGEIEAVAAPTELSIIGNVVTCSGNSPIPGAIIAIRDLTQAIVAENVLISLDNGGTHDRFGIWLFNDPPGNPSQLVVNNNLFSVVSFSADSSIKFDTSNQIVFDGNMTFVDATVPPNAGLAMRPVSTPGQDWIVSGNMMIPTAGAFTAGFLIECGGSNSIHNVLCNHNLVGASTNGIFWDATGFPFFDWRACNGNITEGIVSQAIVLPTTLVGVTMEGNAGQNAQIALSGTTPSGHVSASVGSLCMNTAGGVDTTLSVKESGTDSSGWVGDGPDELQFGVVTANATTTNQFLAPGFALPTESAVEIKIAMPRPGNLRNLRLQCTAGVGGGNNTFTIRKNGVDTGLALTVANTASSGNTNVNQPAFAAGDLLSIRTSKTLAPGTPQTNIVLSFEITS